MTAAMIFVLVFVFVLAIDVYRWYNCKKAPLTETMLRLAILVRFSLSKEARAEFTRAMNHLTFATAAKAYLKR
jgi:hypothetical protein